MVFEAVVVELLNKFLKQYVENLDTSQLKIGIWGGDVVLNDLKIKTTIFDDFNIPIRVKWGKLGKLAMKIPWKNLYGSQVVVNVEELLVVVTPNNEFQYDAEKEEKWAQDRKQAKLRAVEEAKKRELEGEIIKQGDSFIEKLLAQIIKNIQITIRNIHIRYEDKTTIPESPISVGMTLSNLSAQTTANALQSSFSNLIIENANFIYKIVDLEGLSIYWNPSSVLFSELAREDLCEALKDSIPRMNFKPQGFSYVFGPLSSSAFLRINPKPELDESNFSIPKIFVHVHLREIDLALTHHQFCDAMLFLKDHQRLAAAAKFKKYRPVGISVIGHAKIWWHFAYNAVAEDIRRRKLEWSWKNIKEHRKMCRIYSDLFKLKLNSKKLPADVVEELNRLEKKLNVFNLILIREQVYVEIERSNLAKSVKKSSSGWFTGWFGYGNDSKADQNDDELVKKIEKVMTVQEKQKLYKAIGYEESAPPTNYPPSFVEVQFSFHLGQIKMSILDDRIDQSIPILTSSIKTVDMEFEQRPSAFAMKFSMVIGNFEVLGKRGGKKDPVPELVTSSCAESESLIEFLYETKPLNASCDQRIVVKARPLRIIYHAETINLAREIFNTGSAEDVNKIVAATSASLPTFQKITAMGLQYAIEKRTILEVKVNIMSSYLIIPYGGVYRPDEDMLVVMLGKLSIESEENEQKDVSIKKLFLEGTTEQDIFSTVVSASYTKFKCQLTGVQILFQLKGEDWVSASTVHGTSPLRFLESTNLAVTIKKSLVTDDARIPKMVIEGKLPSLAINFSEERFISFAALVCSIPTHMEVSAPLSKKNLSASAWSLQSIGTQLEHKLVHIQKDLTATRSTEYIQGIDLVGHFEMNELVVNVSKSRDFMDKRQKETKEESKKPYVEEKFLTLKVIKLEIELTNKTFETINLLKLGKIEFNQHHKKNILPFVSTRATEKDYYLFVVEYVNLDTKVPDFYTRRGAIVNRLTLNVTPLNVVLNKEALLAQIAFVTNLQTRLDEVKQNCQADKMADIGKLKETIPEDFQEGVHPDKKVIITKGKRFRKKRTQKEVVDFFLDATVEEVDIVVEFEGQGLAEFCMTGGSVEISTRKSYTNVDFKLREVFVSDLNPGTFYPKIVTSLEKQTLSSRVTMYNSEYFGSEKSVDMSVEAEVGGLHCVFLNFFFSRAFEFLNAFQSQIQSLKEGASVAAQRAKENVMKAYQNAHQLCLDIKITAPILVIPKGSNDLEALLVDLGVLTIKNSIMELDYSPDGGSVSRPTIDTMKVHLQNLKFSRCFLNKDTMIPENEKPFAIPISFEMTIKRNLSLNWFRVIPELEVLGRLAAIHVTLTHRDLCCIVGIGNENMKEGAPAKSGKGHLSRHHEQKASKHKEPTQEQHQVVLHESEEPENDEKVANYYTRMKFMFFMDSFIFDAVNEKDNSDDTSEKTGLARFVLETISLKGRMFSDKSVHTSIMLISCVLDDTRPGKEGRLTRLMERTVDSNTGESSSEVNPVNSMIEIIYQKKELDTFIDTRVYKFTLILSMDFLQKLGEFFTVEDSRPTAAFEVSDSSKTIRVLEKRSKIVKEEDDSRPPTFTINLKLEKPDIIIVENMDSINTDALIFNTEMIMKYRIAGVRQVISGTLSDIELYSCCFNPSKRRHTLSQVIKPFTISVAGSTPQGQGLHIDICLTEILISINPSTVELIAKCYEALFSDSWAVQGEPAEIDYSDLWDIKTFNPDDFWFLRAEEGVDALTEISSSTSLLGEKHSAGEICLLAVPSVIVSLEGQSVKQSKPLLLLELGFQMQCFNWSQKMTINNSLTLQLQYYNKILSSWEPLIEPIEEISEKDGKHTYVPWELTCNVVFGEEGDIEELKPPKIAVSLACTEMLQITLTKTCLEVLKNVVETYTSAVNRGVIKKLPDLPPYVVKNETGLVVELLLDESKLQVCKAINDDYKIVRLESNSEVELQNIPEPVSALHRFTSMSNIRKDTRLHVKFPISSKNVFELPLGTNSKRYYPLPIGEFENGEVWGLVSDVSIMDNSTTVVLCSILKVINYFIEPINVHALSEDGKEAEYVGTVEGNSTFSLPFHAVYSANRKLFFSVNGYSLSIQSLVWENIKKEFNSSTLLQCNSKIPENNDPFFIQAVGEAEQINYGNTNRRTLSSFCYKIHLQPTVKIFNSLPVDLIICFQGNAIEKLLHPGNNLQITNAEPGASTVTLRISEYLEKEWSCKETILENPPEFFIWKFVSYNGLAPEALNLGVHVTYKRKTAVYSIYCPYFMVNKTEHLLAYKFESSPTVFYHPGDHKLPVMFSPTSRKFFSKKSALLQVMQSEWSDKFPVDVAGSGGTVECVDPASNITYKISVTITLTYNSLTRIVVFTPFYVIVNATKYAIECQECDFLEEPWLEIAEGACLPFWPRSQAKVKTIQVRPHGADAVTPPFGYESTDTCLLRLNHKYGGIFVNIQATQSGTYITFTSYEPGQAPALIVNHSAKIVKLIEQDARHTTIVKPMHEVMHSWLAPTGERKLIVMNPKHMKDIIHLEQDTEGLVFTSKGEIVRYVSFLDGAQRVLLFTDDRGLSRSISNTLKVTFSGVEVVCRIQGVGLSLVNNITRVEILYMGFVSSGIAWEGRKHGRTRFKPLNSADVYKIENAYEHYLHETETKTDVNPVVEITDKLMVDFEHFELLQPNRRKLRRTFEPGLWIAYRVMEDQVMLHIKINRIQIDNQLRDCIFPIILSPTPPPKTVATLNQGAKPFVELSIVKIVKNKNNVEQFKYFKILVQEFHVKIDNGFLQQFWQFLAQEEMSDEEQKIFFQKDLEFTQKPLMSHVEVVSSNEQKNFYDLLHFSPLKIHFSFSLAGNIGSESLPPSFSVMIQSLGVTLTDIHDVIFRLSYFERKCAFLTNSQLQSEVISHYYGQTIRQAYVLLLGLDVIGNPYGLIVGIGQGVEAFFYEPFQGIIQGPADFATGVAIGCKSLLGHTVGSTASTLGKLTETLGKGLAVLSLDKEYQIQRMENMNKHENIQASMARGGKGLVMGVFEGVTGIVKKPIEGAKEEGVGGFFKGMGKGMMGLVTRPVSGVVDFASTSLNAVKRVAEPTVENRRLRPPRFFRHPSLVQPYNLLDAQGSLIFYLICKRKYCSTDKYEFHAQLKGKEVVVLTNKRILLAEYSEIFGTWQEHLALTWKSMPDRPRCHTKGVAIAMPLKNSGSKPNVKILLIEDKSLKEEICKRMAELYKLEKEDSS